MLSKQRAKSIWKKVFQTENSKEGNIRYAISVKINKLHLLPERTISHSLHDKGNNKITELWTILQRESQNS